MLFVGTPPPKKKWNKTGEYIRLYYTYYVCMFPKESRCEEAKGEEEGQQDGQQAPYKPPGINVDEIDGGGGAVGGPKAT